MQRSRKVPTRSLAAARGVAIAAALALPGVGSAAGPLADGSVLPFPPTPSASVAKPTLQESTHRRRVEPRRIPADAPNVLIVLLDDVGFGA